jgi:hypothetical protein
MDLKIREEGEASSLPQHLASIAPASFASASEHRAPLRLA